jgi:hypothetical protein
MSQDKITIKTYTIVEEVTEMTKEEFYNKYADYYKTEIEANWEEKTIGKTWNYLNSKDQIILVRGNDVEDLELNEDTFDYSGGFDSYVEDYLPDYINYEAEVEEDKVKACEEECEVCCKLHSIDEECWNECVECNKKCIGEDNWIFCLKCAKCYCFDCEKFDGDTLCEICGAEDEDEEEDDEDEEEDDEDEEKIKMERIADKFTMIDSINCAALYKYDPNTTEEDFKAMMNELKATNWKVLDDNKIVFYHLRDKGPFAHCLECDSEIDVATKRQGSRCLLQPDRWICVECTKGKHSNCKECMNGVLCA